MTAHPRPHPPAASRSQLVEAARLGATVAAADLSGDPAQAAAAFASWRRLRRRTGRQSRQLLRVAFDTGYGRGMQTGMQTGVRSELRTAGSDPA